MEKISEPVLFSKKYVQTTVVVPFPIQHLEENWEKQLIEFGFNHKGKSFVALWEKAPFADEGKSKFFSSQIKEMWFFDQSKDACRHYKVPSNSLEFLFPNSRTFGLYNREIRGAKNITLADRYRYRVEEIGLTVFPFSVACIYVKVKHLLKDDLKLSHSISMLKRLNSQMVLHEFYDPEKHTPNSPLENSFLSKERDSIPIGQLQSKGKAISIKRFLNTLLLKHFKKNKSYLYFSDYTAHLYTNLPVQNGQMDSKNFSQWLYYFSSGALLPSREEESYPELVDQNPHEYDIATYHKRTGLVIRFCREGVLALGEISDEKSFLYSQWPNMFGTKYFLLYLQVLAEHYIIESFQDQGRKLYRKHYNGQDVQEELEGLVNEMSSFQMMFSLLTCGPSTDINIFFESARNVLTLDRRIKMHKDLLVQVIDLIGTIKDRKRVEIEQKQHTKQNERQLELMVNQQKSLEALEDLGVNQKESLDALKSFGSQQQRSLEALEDLGVNQKESLEALKSFGSQQQRSLEALEDLGVNQKESLDALKSFGGQQQRSLEELEDLGENQKDSLEALKSFGENQDKAFEEQQKVKRYERSRDQVIAFLGVIAIPFTILSGILGMNINGKSYAGIPFTELIGQIALWHVLLGSAGMAVVLLLGAWGFISWSESKEIEVRKKALQDKNGAIQ